MKSPLPPDTIYAVISDGHNMHCLTEDQIDAWFLSLSADRKAELYEAETEGLLEGSPAHIFNGVLPQSLEEHAARFERRSAVLSAAS
jgi:hypothetical protein